MSSTWFRNVTALKTKIPFLNDSTLLYEHYILIAETAESNLYNYNGGHDYNKDIIAEGEYEQVVAKVCTIAPSFDTGSCKWKPNNKDCCGFIRMCKKALDEATESETIPYDVHGIIFWNHVRYDYIVKMFENQPNIEKIRMYNNDALITHDMKTYIKTKDKIRRMIEDYKEYICKKTDIKFEDYYNEKKEYYESF